MHAKLSRYRQYQGLIGAAFAILVTIVWGQMALGELQPVPPLPISASQIQFTYESQDGEFAFPCRHEINHPVLLDWDVRCADPARPQTERRFTVHLRVFRFTKSRPPKTAYQILFEVTNHAIPIGRQGHYVGSTMWMRFDGKAPLSSLSLSQDIENTTALSMRLGLSDY